MDTSFKVMQWNICSDDNPMTGIKRYEDELFNNSQYLINVERIKRTSFKRSYWMDILKFKSNNSDIIHATFQTLAPLKIVKRPTNFVLTVHDIIPYYYNTNKKIKSMWYLLRYTIPKADKIITDSTFTKNELIYKLNVDKNKIEVVPLGVSDAYKPLNKEECKNHFDLDHNKKYVLIVSSIESWKNMSLVNKIIEHSTNYTFIKIGYNQNLNNSKIINLGHIDESNMPFIYNACDLFLHTSLYEGFGLPILEAMACGCPVVSSNAASIPEVMKNAGILLDAKDTEDNAKEFAWNIYNVFSNETLKAKLITLGLNRAKELSWMQTVKKTVDVYKQLV